jgi:hypothetical protein
LVNSGPRDCGSDSPVNDELSTLKPCALMTRISAGTRSPNLTSTRSPTTNSSAFKFFFSPPRIANACYKRKKVFQIHSSFSVVRTGGTLKKKSEDLEIIQ